MKTEAVGVNEIKDFLYKAKNPRKSTEIKKYCIIN